MKVALALVLVLQFLILPANASSIRAYYDVGGIWSDNNIIVDGTPIEMGFFTGYDLREAMKSNPQALEYAQSARTQWIWGSSLTWGGLGLALGYMATTRPFDVGTYWLIFLGGFIPGAFLHASSQMKTMRAINSYNGLKYDGRHWSGFSIVPTSNGALASTSWSF